MRLSRNLVVAVAAIALLAAVGVLATRLLSSSDDPSHNLDRFVLTSSDLPRGYRQVERPAAGCSDPVFERSETRRLRDRGLVRCAVVKYRRQATDGVGLVYLQSYLFDDARSASAALPQMRSHAVAQTPVVIKHRVVSKHSLPAPALGDEAPRGVRLTVGSPRGLPFSYVYWWRRDKVVAESAVFGMMGDFDERTALALARRIDARATR